MALGSWGPCTGMARALPPHLSPWPSRNFLQEHRLYNNRTKTATVFQGWGWSPGSQTSQANTLPLIYPQCKGQEFKISTDRILREKGRRQKPGGTASSYHRKWTCLQNDSVHKCIGETPGGLEGASSSWELLCILLLFIYFFSENSKFVSISLLSSLGGTFQTLVLAKDEGTVSSEWAEQLLAGLDLLSRYKTHKLTPDVSNKCLQRKPDVSDKCLQRKPVELGFCHSWL